MKDLKQKPRSYKHFSVWDSTTQVKEMCKQSCLKHRKNWGRLYAGSGYKKPLQYGLIIPRLVSESSYTNALPLQHHSRQLSDPSPPSSPLWSAYQNQHSYTKINHGITEQYLKVFTVAAKHFLKYFKSVFKTTTLKKCTFWQKKKRTIMSLLWNYHITQHDWEKFL